jgi:hypothetical protein
MTTPPGQKVSFESYRTYYVSSLQELVSVIFSFANNSGRRRLPRELYIVEIPVNSTCLVYNVKFIMWKNEINLIKKLPHVQYIYSWKRLHDYTTYTLTGFDLTTHISAGRDDGRLTTPPPWQKNEFSFFQKIVGKGVWSLTRPTPPCSSRTRREGSATTCSPTRRSWHSRSVTGVAQWTSHPPQEQKKRVRIPPEYKVYRENYV